VCRVSRCLGSWVAARRRAERQGPDAKAYRMYRDRIETAQGLHRECMGVLEKKMWTLPLNFAFKIVPACLYV
jgi:hypothetical protein